MIKPLFTYLILISFIFYGCNNDDSNPTPQNCWSTSTLPGVSNEGQFGSAFGGRYLVLMEKEYIAIVDNSFNKAKVVKKRLPKAYEPANKMPFNHEIYSLLDGDTIIVGLTQSPENYIRLDLSQIDSSFLKLMPAMHETSPGVLLHDKHMLITYLNQQAQIKLIAINFNNDISLSYDVEVNETMYLEGEEVMAFSKVNTQYYISTNRGTWEYYKENPINNPNEPGSFKKVLDQSLININTGIYSCDMIGFTEDRALNIPYEVVRDVYESVRYYNFFWNEITYPEFDERLLSTKFASINFILIARGFNFAYDQDSIYFTRTTDNKYGLRALKFNKAPGEIITSINQSMSGNIYVTTIGNFYDTDIDCFIEAEGLGIPKDLSNIVIVKPCN